MNNKLLILLLLCFFSSIYSQEKFKLATELTNGTKFYIKELGNYEAWVKTVEKTKNVKGKNGKMVKTGGNSSIEFWKCNCNVKKYSSDSGISYDRNGNVKSELQEIYDERVLPDTAGETILNIICGYDEYLEDKRQKEFDQEFSVIQRELDEGVSRYNNYSDGYKTGYKEGYCSPYSDCYHQFPGMPSESYFAENPKDDYDKGYNDGMEKGTADKSKK